MQCNFKTYQFSTLSIWNLSVAEIYWYLMQCSYLWLTVKWKVFWLLIRHNHVVKYIKIHLTRIYWWFRIQVPVCWRWSLYLTGSPQSVYVHMRQPGGVESGWEWDSGLNRDTCPTRSAPLPLDRSGQQGQEVTRPSGSGWLDQHGTTGESGLWDWIRTALHCGEGFLHHNSTITTLTLIVTNRTSMTCRMNFNHAHLF